MKRNILFFITAGMLCFLPAQVLAGPSAVVEEPVYEFESVVEGEHVYHEFVVKNTGDAPLNIIKVSPP